MGKPRVVTGRAQRVLAWLDRQRTPKSQAEITEAADPGCPSYLMSGTLSTLRKAGKLERVGSRPNVKYRTTPTALVDGRAAAQEARRAQTKQPKRRTSGYRDPLAAAAEVKRRDSRARRIKEAMPEPAPAPAPNRARAIQAAAKKLATPAAAPTSHLPPTPRRAPMNHFFLRTEVDARRPMREALAADVAAFEAGGGVIQRLAPAESSRPLVSAQEWNEASWRARERRLAETALTADSDD